MRRSILGGSLAVLLGTFFSGCTSFTSTLIESGDDPCGRKDKTHLRGYPITLHVPTHVRVDLVEEFYFGKNGQNELSAPIKCNGNLLRTYDVRTQIIKTDKIFTVDYKRPAAGIINYNTRFTEDQYIAQVQTQLVDNTIVEVGNAVQRFMTNVATGQALPADQLIDVNMDLRDVTGVADFGSADVSTKARAVPTVRSYKSQIEGIVDPPNSVKHTRVVASRMFSLDDPAVAEQVSTFLCEHGGG
jgi:hypothetical protein